jgi:hypothetical protein
MYSIKTINLIYIKLSEIVDTGNRNFVDLEVRHEGFIATGVNF